MLNTNLLQIKLNNIQHTGAVSNNTPITHTAKSENSSENRAKNSNLLSKYLNNQAVINTPLVTSSNKTSPVEDKKHVKKMLYTNDLKTLFKRP